MSNQLPLMCGKLNENDIVSLYLPEKERKINLVISHLLRMKEKEPTLETSDFAEFIAKAQVTGADPIKEQIFLVSYNKKMHDGSWRKFGTTIFSYHFFISKAESNKNYDGFETSDGIGEYFNQETGKIERQPYAVCRAFRKDVSRPFEYKAWFPEFAKRKNDGKLNEQWKSKPMLMLTKCAVCNALKQAFPNDLAAIDTSETIGVNAAEEIESIDTTARTIKKEEIKEEEKKEEIKPTTIMGEYVVTFGEFKGKKLKEIPLYDLNKFTKFVEEEAKKRGSSSGEVATFIDRSQRYIRGE